MCRSTLAQIMSVCGLCRHKYGSKEALLETKIVVWQVRARNMFPFFFSHWERQSEKKCLETENACSLIRPGYHMGHLKTETFVNAFAVFKAFWAQCGRPEDRGT